MAGHLLKIDMSWSLSDSDVGAGAICEKHRKCLESVKIVSLDVHLSAKHPE